MRVTKIIRDYVIKEVNKAIPNQHLCPAYVEMKEKADCACAEIEAKVKAYGEELIAKARTDIGLPADWTMETDSFHRFRVSLDCFNSALCEQERKLCREAGEKRAAAIESVLLDLELGAVTKAELAEAIAKAVV